ALETFVPRNRSVTSDRASEENRDAGGAFLNSFLPTAGIICAELHHISGEDGRMRRITPQNPQISVFLLHNGVAKLRIGRSRLAHQPISNELPRQKAAMAKLRRLQIRNGLSCGRHKPIRKPWPRGRIKISGKRLADEALAPPAQTAMGMRR